MSYAEQVQSVIDRLVQLGERAEAANQHTLSAWFGSLCKWVRFQEEKGVGFMLTLPDPALDTDVLEVLAVEAAQDAASNHLPAQR